jgi:protein-L-isoaspartate(D-aspartate) O-methyltransferase
MARSGLRLGALWGALMAGSGSAGAASEGGGDPSEPDFRGMRERMVAEQIESRGVRNTRVLDAMREVSRHDFVPEALQGEAYRDHPLPIGLGQTISQPYVVAAMTEALDPQPGDTVLEIGTGSGYQAAILSKLVKKVYSIEIVEELGLRARATLAERGYSNVEVIVGDGFRGLPEHAPFDGIIVTAAPEEVPPPLLEQLAPGAKLVIPVGDFSQDLRVIERVGDGTRSESLFPVRFVPMTGEAQSR